MIPHPVPIPPLARKTGPTTWGPRALRVVPDLGTLDQNRHEVSPIGTVAPIVYSDADGIALTLEAEMADDPPRLLAASQHHTDRLITILEAQSRAAAEQLAADKEAERDLRARELAIREQEAANIRRIFYAVILALIVLAGGRAVAPYFPRLGGGHGLARRGATPLTLDDAQALDLD